MNSSLEPGEWAAAITSEVAPRGWRPALVGGYNRPGSYVCLLPGPEPPMSERARANDKTIAVLARAVAGDRMAVGELLYRQSDDLRTFVAERLPDVIRPTVDADDVLQDTFAVAFRQIGTFEGTVQSFSAWLRRIAANRIIDLTRTQTRQKRGGPGHKTAVSPAAADNMLGLYDELAMTESTPLRNASREEALRLMHVALAELPADYREAIRLRYLERRPCQEVAEILDRTPEAVHGVVRRAKARLRDALGRASSYLSSD